jgi:hypothetical protein
VRKLQAQFESQVFIHLQKIEIKYELKSTETFAVGVAILGFRSIRLHRLYHHHHHHHYKNYFHIYLLFV